MFVSAWIVKSCWSVSTSRRRRSSRPRPRSPFAMWLNAKWFYCCELPIFIPEWNNQPRGLFRGAGGDLSGLILSRVYPAWCRLRMLAKPPPVSGVRRMNSLAGPSAWQDVSALSCRTFTVPSVKLWARTPPQTLRGRRRRPDHQPHAVLRRRRCQFFCFLCVLDDGGWRFSSCDVFWESADLSSLS